MGNLRYLVGCHCFTVTHLTQVQLAALPLLLLDKGATSLGCMRKAQFCTLCGETFSGERWGECLRMGEVRKKRTLLFVHKLDLGFVLLNYFWWGEGELIYDIVTDIFM